MRSREAYSREHLSALRLRSCVSENTHVLKEQRTEVRWRFVADKQANALGHCEDRSRPDTPPTGVVGENGECLVDRSSRRHDQKGDGNGEPPKHMEAEEDHLCQGQAGCQHSVEEEAEQNNGPCDKGGMPRLRHVV